MALAPVMGHVTGRAAFFSLLRSNPAIWGSAGPVQLLAFNAMAMASGALPTLPLGNITRQPAIIVVMVDPMIGLFLGFEH
jgi:hypothetical protein